MNIVEAIYLGGVGLFAAILAAMWLRYEYQDRTTSEGARGEVPFWPAVLLAVAWPIALLAFFAMIITKASSPKEPS